MPRRVPHGGVDEAPDFAVGQVWVPRIGRSSMPRLIEQVVKPWPWRRAWRWRHVSPGTRTDVWSERRLRTWVRSHRAVCLPVEETD